MEVLSGTEISSQVIALIEGARKILVLVTPYFDPWGRLSTAIKAARTQHGVKVRLLLRGGEDRAKQEEKAKELISFGVEVTFLERLHAKVYVSESQAIVTSMNLLKSSAIDSWEIAMRADAKTDATVYNDIVRHVVELIKRAQADSHISAHAQVATAHKAITAALSETTTARAPSAPPKAAPALKKLRQVAPTGHCIRCGEDIAFDPDHPFCATCLKSWSRYKNPDYEEAHCHACGKDKKTSMAKPLCRPCWEANA